MGTATLRIGIRAASCADPSLIAASSARKGKRPTAHLTVTKPDRRPGGFTAAELAAAEAPKPYDIAMGRDICAHPADELIVYDETGTVPRPYETALRVAEQERLAKRVSRGGSR